MADYNSSYTGEQIDSAVGLALSSAQMSDVETTIINAQTGTSYTATIDDRGQTVTMGSDSDNTFIIPKFSSVQFGIGSVITVLRLGTSETTVAAVDTDVTLNGIAGGSGTINTQYQGVSVLKIDSDSWVAIGDIGTIA